MNSNGSRTRIQLLFAHEGAFHTEVVSVPAARIEQYDRLIDFLREDPEVARQLYVDLKKLASARIAEEE